MKRLLLSGALLAIGLGMSAQPGVLKTTSTPTVVPDTLHYFLNKYYFKTGNSDLKTYPNFRTDATATAASTAITYCGSKFEVPAGDTVFVTGLEGYAAKSGSAANLNIPLRLYLFHVDPVSGLPVMPPIDSVQTGVPGASVNSPSLVGGNFTSTTTAAARTMTNTFAVMIRNMSGVAGDYVHFLRTSGATDENKSVHPEDYHGEGYGIVRFNGQFYSTKNFSMASGFGQGTDYEFMVAPRVSYTLQASHKLPYPAILSDSQDTPDTVCTRSLMTFTNTSSPFYEHRQYNLYQFYRKWNLYYPFPQSVLGAFSQDSSITWDFQFYEPEMPDTRVALPYVNSGTVSAITGMSYYPDCFSVNQFRARLKKMAALGKGGRLAFSEDFKLCLKFCNGDAVGVSSHSPNSQLKIFPNPAIHGRTQISGMEGTNTVEVYDILGQLISKEIISERSYEIDLSERPKGTYLVKVTGASGHDVKVMKIMNQN
jgi:hypothetical protein